MKLFNRRRTGDSEDSEGSRFIQFRSEASKIANSTDLVQAAVKELDGVITVSYNTSTSDASTLEGLRSKINDEARSYTLTCTHTEKTSDRIMDTYEDIQLGF